MPSRVFPGRHSAQIDGEFVVFVIGMRFNKPWKVAEWWPIFSAMPKMLRYLEQHPEKGLLGNRTALSGLTPVLVQYWRSFEHLEAFAKDAEDPHLEPWREYNRKARDSGDVGIFHETYRIGPGDFESIYVNMTASGLAGAGTMTPVGSTSRARARMAGEQGEAAATQS